MPSCLSHETGFPWDEWTSSLCIRDLNSELQVTDCKTLYRLVYDNIVTNLSDKKRAEAYIFTQRIASDSSILITKTYLYNFDPLNPHFYTVKTGV